MIYIEYSPETRFGNWLFQYATACQLSGGEEVAFYIAPKHQQTERVSKYASVFKKARFVNCVSEDLQIVTPQMLEIGDVPRCESYMLSGVFQNFNFFTPELARKLYECPSDIDEELAKEWGKILTSRDIVSVHIRRGDYLDLPHRHPFVGKEYLRKAVCSFPRGTAFLICSDDIRWAQDFFSQNRFHDFTFLYSQRGSVLSDFYLMVKCRHHIISNSTFSWWAAYLGQYEGTRVIMPSMWFGIAMECRRPNGTYVPCWEVVENRYSIGQFFHAVLLLNKTRLGNVLRKLHLMRKPQI